MQNSPCHNCSTRRLCCHTVCAAYLDWVGAMRFVKENRMRYHAERAVAIERSLLLKKKLGK